MSSGHTFSPQLESFLRARIETHEELETLLLLRREPDTSWDPESVAARLRIERERATDTLVSLTDKRLLRVRRSASANPYCYDPDEAAVDAVVAQLDQAFRDRRLDLIKLMNSNAMMRMRTRAIRAFADAFVIPKRDKDG